MALPLLLARLAGKTAQQAFADHVAAVERKYLKFQEAIAAATGNLNELYAGLLAEFLKSPTPTAVERIIQLEMKKPVAGAVAYSLHGSVVAAKDAEMEKGRGLLIAAIAEALQVVRESRAKIAEEDQKLAEERGVECVASPALERLDRIEERLDQARQLAPRDFSRAWSDYRSAISAPPKPRKEYPELRTHNDAGEPVLPDSMPAARHYTLNGGR